MLIQIFHLTKTPKRYGPIKRVHMSLQERPSVGQSVPTLSLVMTEGLTYRSREQCN
jgi:hypothetical protein